MSQGRKSSSAASQPHKVYKINHLHDWTLAELLSAVPSAVCAGQAALDDLRNWRTWFNSLRTFPSSSNIDVRISRSSHRVIIVVGWLAPGALGLVSLSHTSRKRILVTQLSGLLKWRSTPQLAKATWSSSSCWRRRSIVGRCCPQLDDPAPVAAGQAKVSGDPQQRLASSASAGSG
jgi:hypothetical protein